MAKLIVKDVSGNYCEEQDNARKTDTVSLDYFIDDGEIVFGVTLNPPDQTLSFTFDLDEFLRAIGKSIMEAEVEKELPKK